jgi:hypothetical protein
MAFRGDRLKRSAALRVFQTDQNALYGLLFSASNKFFNTYQG